VSEFPDEAETADRLAPNMMQPEIVADNINPVLKR